MSSINSLWVSADLRAAASAAKDALYAGMRLIAAAESHNDPSNENLVGEFRNVLHCAQLARNGVRPLVGEFLAARRTLARPVPTIGGVADATAVGLCVAWAYHVMERYGIPFDDGKGTWGSLVSLDPSDVRLAVSRDRLKSQPSPDRNEIEREIDLELSAAEMLRHVGLPTSERSTDTGEPPIDQAPIDEDSPAVGGRTVQREDHDDRKLVAERWKRFKLEYRSLGYSRATYEHFAAWAREEFEDMPSDNPSELKRMVEAHGKTPSPRKLV